MGRKPTPPPPYRNQFPISDDSPPRRLVAPAPERKTRPATIRELADMSREDLWDPEKSIRHWVNAEDLARRTGKHYAMNGDYERGFAQLTRSASILENIPTHKDYHMLLTSTRDNLISVILSFFFPARPHRAPSSFPLFPTLPWGSPLLLPPRDFPLLPTLSSNDLLIVLLLTFISLSSNT